MHKKIISGLIVLGLVGVLGAPLAVRAWAPLVVPDCETGPMVGRTPPVDTGGRYPSQMDDTEHWVTQNLTSYSVFDYHGPSTFGHGLILRGFPTNIPETQVRSVVASLVNGLKIECILQKTIARIGLSFDQRIDDNAAYDVNTRNHSLYQRTNDLQAEMVAMREEIAALRQEIRRVNTLGAVGATGGTAPSVTTLPVVPFNAGSGAVITPSVPLVPDTKVVPSATPDTKVITPPVSTKDDGSAHQLCLDACGTAQLTCMKRATTSKELVRCSSDRTQCESTCK